MRSAPDGADILRLNHEALRELETSVQSSRARLRAGLDMIGSSSRKAGRLIRKARDSFANNPDETKQFAYEFAGLFHESIVTADFLSDCDKNLAAIVSEQLAEHKMSGNTAMSTDEIFVEDIHGNFALKAYRVYVSLDSAPLPSFRNQQ